MSYSWQKFEFSFYYIIQFCSITGFFLTMMSYMITHDVRPLVKTAYQKKNYFSTKTSVVARRLRAKFWPDCAIPDTSMKFGTVADHD